MIQRKLLQGPCSSCGKTIKYAAHLVGTTGPCPLCGRPTEFVLEEPPQHSFVDRRTLIWALAAILVLVLGLVAAIVALKSAQNLPKPPRQGKPSTSLQSPAPVRDHIFLG